MRVSQTPPNPTPTQTHKRLSFMPAFFPPLKLAFISIAFTMMLMKSKAFLKLKKPPHALRRLLLSSQPTNIFELRRQVVKNDFEQLLTKVFLDNKEKVKSIGGDSIFGAEGVDLTKANWALGESSILSKEWMPYDDGSRQGSAEKALRIFKRRRSQRKSAGEHSYDKIHNPLCLVIGSPGSGKSAFLRHFAYSPCYMDYVKEQFPLDPRPIVAPITFGADAKNFHKTREFFDVRMLYGAAMELFFGLGIAAPFTWKEFSNKFHGNEEITHSGAELLEETFGANRPIVLLVDNISHLNEDDLHFVLYQIGCNLNGEEQVDCLLSSPSPMRVKNVMTGGQRSVCYTLLPPLSHDSEVMRRLTSAFIAWLREDEDIARAMELPESAFNVQLLRSLPLMLNGYPQELESCLVRKEDSDSRRFQDKIKEIVRQHLPTGSSMAMFLPLMELLNESSIFLSVDGKEKNDLLSDVLRRHSKRCHDNSRPDMQSNIEAPALFMENPSNDDTFFPSLPVVKLLAYARDGGANNDVLQDDQYYLLQTQRALGNMTSETNISELFARAVRLMIGSAHSPHRSSQLFGVDVRISPYARSDDIHLIIASSQDIFSMYLNDAMEHKKERISTIGTPNNVNGFNGVTICGDEYVYDLIKCGRTADDSLEKRQDILAAKLRDTLLFHLKNVEPTLSGKNDFNNSDDDDDFSMERCLSHVHFIFYDWDENGGAFSRDALLKALERIYESLDESLTAYDDAIYYYFERYFEENVRIMDKNAISHWMPPTLLQLARITDVATSK